MSEDRIEPLLRKIEELENENALLKGFLIMHGAAQSKHPQYNFNAGFLKRVVKNNHFLYVILLRFRSWLRK
jgi:hypothetical protein